MAMIGLSKSSSVIPVARQRARAPAMLRPWVVVRERYAGMAPTLTRPPPIPPAGTGSGGGSQWVSP